MLDASREALQLFLEMADRLGKTRYVRWLQENRGTMLLLSEHEDEVSINRKRPDDDATQAFVLTFRFFIQEREASSFLSLSKTALADPGVSERWKGDFVAIRDALNAFLDAPTHQNKPTFEPATGAKERKLRLLDEAGLTHRTIMQTFIYGDLAHANNPRHRARYKQWRADRVHHALLEIEFDKILQGMLPAIWRLARLSEHELAAEFAPPR